jgi:hypothetical protein
MGNIKINLPQDSETSGASCGYYNETSDSLTGEKFHKASAYQILKDSAPRSWYY